MNHEHSQIDAPMPPIDFGEIELGIVRGFPLIGNSNLMSIWQIPFKMSAYRVTERERANVSQRENSESGSDGASTCDESIVPIRRRGDRVAYSDGKSDEYEFGEPTTRMTMSPRTRRSSGHASDSELP
ncbi:hypothetical protein MIMGU_mgv1a016304mg [Erythranthe guttata]|uniref:Uncharacterized protein n=1 Tax=Erythranthe guttata TaxID=4155 RepID=A0A022RLR7_ERYGU|nr:hypothetical protein MIMGU_mgv1a016304mg [Erythranthe guttata]